MFQEDETSPTKPSMSSSARAIAAPAIRGSIWTLGGYAASQAIRFLSNIVLTRLLFPEVFGQMALVAVFLQGLNMFSDVGTGPSIIQNPRGDDPVFLNTAWTIQCGRGILLWLAACAVARPVAHFYHQPLFAWLIPAAGLTAVMGGFEATSMHTLQRHLRLGTLTIVDLVTQVLGTIATLVLARLDQVLYGPKHAGAVWALIGGWYVTGLVRLVASHTVLPGIRHRLSFEPEAARVLFRFGRWIFLSTVLTFFAGQSDRMIFGKMIPLDLLGVYGIALALATIPTQAVQKLGAAVMFPAYSRLAGTPDFGRFFKRVPLPLLIAGAAMVSGLVACGPFLIRVLYDNRYLQAGWIIQYLAVLAWFQILECTNGAALLALGSARWVAAGSATKVLIMLVCIPIGHWLAGFPGALMGLVVSEAAKYVTSAIGVTCHRLGGSLRNIALTALVGAVSCVAILTGVMIARTWNSNLAQLFGAAIVTGTLWFGLALWFLRRDTAMDLRKWLTSPLSSWRRIGSRGLQ
jgi:O-antigen/teichoic acid export membrane protein